MSSRQFLRGIAASLTLLACGGGAKGASTIIDTFDQTPQVSNGGNVSITSGVTEALGGARDVYASGPSSTVSGSSPGTFTVGNSRGDTNYGIRGGGPQLNEDWNAYLQFELDFQATPNGGALEIVMHTLNNAQYVIWGSQTVPTSTTPFTLVIPFSAATRNQGYGDGPVPPDAAQLGDVDGVGFRFDSSNGLTGLQWRVTDGVAVPEPTAGLLAGLALVGFLRRRRR